MQDRLGRCVSAPASLRHRLSQAHVTQRGTGRNSGVISQRPAPGSGPGPPSDRGDWLQRRGKAKVEGTGTEVGLVS